MARKFSLIALVLSLAGLSAAPATAAVGVGGAKAVSSPARASASTLIAPASTCPGQDRTNAPVSEQEQAMRCLTDFARAQFGMSALAPNAALDQSALEKSADVLHCDDFSHFACDREFTYWMRETGYVSAPCWRVGENLAFGSGEYGSPRSIFQAWMRSPGHRANILGDFAELGVRVQVGTLAGSPGTRVWAQHFGSHCE